MRLIDGPVTAANVPPCKKNCVANLPGGAAARRFIARDGAAMAKQQLKSQLIANHAIMLMFIPFILSSNLREEYSRATRK
ncbi:MAG TPA: hypothetical protein VIE47_04210 [Methylocystis sp.]